MSNTKEEITNMRKQAFYDSHTNYKSNIDKYKNISDPILQQKDKYVRKNIFIILNELYNLLQKEKEYKAKIESVNYYKKMDLEKSKIQRPKKTFIERKDCLDNQLKVKTALEPQLPKRKSIIAEYEKKNHQEKIKRKPIKYIPQEDNAFNFQPPQKPKTQKKMATEQIPSNYYQKSLNQKNVYNYWLNEKSIKKYDDKGRKDNLNELMKYNTEGNDYKERMHKKVNYKDTEVNQIFEKGKNNLPVGYSELTKKIGKVDFNELSNSAKNNFENIKKNGRKPLKKDF